MSINERPRTTHNKEKSAGSRFCPAATPKEQFTGCELQINIKTIFYDVLIVGGGLVGASLALGLKNRLPPDTKIALIDSVFLKKKSQTDNRTIALSHTSLKILQALSQSSFNEFKNSPIETVHISKQGRFAITRLKASDVNLKALGYCIEMNTLVNALYEDLKKTDCELIGAKVKEVKRSERGWKITLEMSEDVTQQISAHLLIAADGDHSMLRQQLNIAVDTHSYEQSAWVTRVQTEKNLNHTAFERFIENGSIALLPIEQDQSQAQLNHHYNAKLVWIEATDNITKIIALTEIEKQKCLKQHLGSRLGNFLAVEEPGFVYPLKSQHADAQVQDQFVLMGNAAHVLHPVAAQGFNLSLRDVAVLVETLAESENDFSSERLNRYLIQRLTDQRKTETFTRALTFFSKNIFPACFLLNSLELFPFLKKSVIRFAMGSYARLPRWVFHP